MKEKILDYFEKEKAAEYPLKKLWWTGIIVFFAYIILLLIQFVYSPDELSLANQLLGSLVGIGFSCYYFAVCYLIIIRTPLKKFQSVNRLLKIGFGGLTIIFLIKNLTPRRIGDDPDYNDSPFDELWYSLPQTAFGYPFPYLRFFGDESFDTSSTIVDFSTLFGNIFMYSFAIYLVTGIYLFLILRSE